MDGEAGGGRKWKMIQKTIFDLFLIFGNSPEELWMSQSGDKRNECFDMQQPFVVNDLGERANLFCNKWVSINFFLFRDSSGELVEWRSEERTKRANERGNLKREVWMSAALKAVTNLWSEPKRALAMLLRFQTNITRRKRKTSSHRTLSSGR